MNRASRRDTPARIKRLDSAGLRLCLAATPGGHLSELEFISSKLPGYDRFLVTTDSAHARSVMPGVEKRYIRRLERNPANVVVNALQTLLILATEPIDAVLSTGAGETFPLMIIASVLGIPVVFIESLARVRSPSITGRLIRHWASLIIVRWPALQKTYPGSTLAAPIVPMPAETPNTPHVPFIAVLTGAGPRGFDRLVEGIDKLVGESSLPRTVFAQIGKSQYVPHEFRYARFLPHEQLLGLIKGSDVVITHDGAGSIGESLRAGKPTIVIPRRPDEGEITYRSDAELAMHLSEIGLIQLVREPSEIPAAIARARNSIASVGVPPEPQPSEIILDFLHRIERSEPIPGN